MYDIQLQVVYSLMCADVRILQSWLKRLGRHWLIDYQCLYRVEVLVSHNLATYVCCYDVIQYVSNCNCGPLCCIDDVI